MRLTASLRAYKRALGRAPTDYASPAACPSCWQKQTPQQMLPVETNEATCLVCALIVQLDAVMGGVGVRGSGQASLISRRRPLVTL